MYVCLNVCLLGDRDEDWQCGGRLVLHNDELPAPLQGPLPSHQAEVEGGSPSEAIAIRDRLHRNPVGQSKCVPTAC